MAVETLADGGTIINVSDFILINLVQVEFDHLFVCVHSNVIIFLKNEYETLISPLTDLSVAVENEKGANKKSKTLIRSDRLPSAYSS